MDERVWIGIQVAWWAFLLHLLYDFAKWAVPAIWEKHRPAIKTPVSDGLVIMVTAQLPDKPEDLRICSEQFATDMPESVPSRRIS